jgi:hypothetical protein
MPSVIWEVCWNACTFQENLPLDGSVQRVRAHRSISRLVGLRRNAKT